MHLVLPVAFVLLERSLVSKGLQGAEEQNSALLNLLTCPLPPHAAFQHLTVVLCKAEVFKHVEILYLIIRPNYFSYSCPLQLLKMHHWCIKKPLSREHLEMNSVAHSFVD